MSTPIGIDLGTTNCCMAWMQNDRVTVYRDEHQRMVMPSIVAQTAAGEMLVGWRAKHCKQPRYRHGFAKRALGSTQQFPLDTGPVDASGISSYLLGELKTRAEQALGTRVSAVITVPAHFLEVHREETRRAAEAAELDVVDLLPEPIAAAIAYHHEHGKTSSDVETILAYDLGGGTMDATVCVRRGERIEVGAGGRAYDGDKFLGGVDFDKALVALVAGQLASQNMPVGTFGDDLPSSQWLWELLLRAEQCKHELSREHETHWTQDVEFSEQLRTTLDLWIARGQFEQAIESLVERTLSFGDRALQIHADHVHPPKDRRDPAAQVRKALETLDRIVLVGGCTLIPSVYERVTAHYQELAGRKIDVLRFKPSECVAIGAAIYSAARTGHQPGASEGVQQWISGPLDRVANEVEWHPELRGIASQRARGGSVELVAGDQRNRASIDGESKFQLPAFPLASGDNTITLSFFDRDDRAVAQQVLTVIRRGISIADPGLARPISMRLIEGLEELLPAGARPGGGESRTFYLNDNSNNARCPLYEGHVAIGAIEFAAGDQPGTPVIFRTVYGRGRLSIDVSVGGRPPQHCDLVLESVPYVGERAALAQRFQEGQRRAEFLLEKLPQESSVARTLKQELHVLRIDIETELANPVVADLNRIDDRLRQMEIIEMRLQTFSLTRDGLSHRLADVRLHVADYGADAESLEELNAIEDAVPPIDDRETLAALHGRLDRLMKRIYLRRPPEITRPLLNYLVQRIRTRLDSIRRDAREPATSEEAERMERVLTDLEQATMDPRVLLHRLVCLEDDLVNPVYQRVVIEKSREGLLRRSAH